MARKAASKSVEMCNQIWASLRHMPRELCLLIIEFMPFKHNLQLLVRMLAVARSMHLANYRLCNGEMAYWAFFNSVHPTRNFDLYTIFNWCEESHKIRCRITWVDDIANNNFVYMARASDIWRKRSFALWNFINGGFELDMNEKLRKLIDDDSIDMQELLRKKARDTMRRAIAIDDCAAIARVWRARRDGTPPHLRR